MQKHIFNTGLHKSRHNCQDDLFMTSPEHVGCTIAACGSDVLAIGKHVPRDLVDAARSCNISIYVFWRDDSAGRMLPPHKP